MVTRDKLRLGTLAATIVALAAVAAGSLAFASRSDATPNGAEGAASETADGTTCEAARGRKVNIAAAKLIIEYNATDDDIGVHGAFDDHGWSELCVYDPSGAQVLAVKPQAQLKDLTVAGIFFESREPPASEFSFDDLKARFPEGLYSVTGTTFDGKILKGAATFTHDVPAAPVVTAPIEGDVLPLDGVVVAWDDVTETVDGEAVTITAYEVIVTKVNHDDPHGFSTPIYDVHVPPDRNTLPVPSEFLEPGTEYELEVLALETSGNQTISVSFFETE